MTVDYLNSAILFRNLEENEYKGKIIFKLEQGSDRRVYWEESMFENTEISSLREEVFSSFKEFVLIGKDKKSINRLQIFYPELTYSQISKLDIKNLIEEIDLNKLNYESFYAYFYFLDKFNDISINNKKLLAQSKQIDTILKLK